MFPFPPTSKTGIYLKISFMIAYETLYSLPSDDVNSVTSQFQSEVIASKRYDR